MAMHTAVAPIASDASSPDPLHDSLIEPKSFITSSPSKQRPHQFNAQNRTRQADRSAVTASTFLTQSPASPSKTVTEQTLSPWKIKVTVEAMPEDNDVTGTMQTITRTTTIPLRGGSSPAAGDHSAKQPRARRSSSRARSRAGSTSPATTRQRSSTPKPDRRRRKQSVTDLDIVVLGDDADEDEWGRRPRKSSPRKTSRRPGRASVESQGISTMLDDFEIMQDESSVRTHAPLEAHHSDSPELRQIDLNKVSVRPRAYSNKQKGAKDFDVDYPIMSKENEESQQYEGPGARKVSVNSTRSYPTPSPTPSNADSSGHHDDEVDSGEGFDTVMESEGFTMIDLDSIPSVQQLRSSPLPTTNLTSEPNVNAAPEVSSLEEHRRPLSPTPGKPFPSYLHLADGESDISSAVPSSPPLPTSQLRRKQPPLGTTLQIPSSMATARHRQVTPQTYSSPRLPSPPRPAPPKDRKSPDSAKVMKAGITLQSAIEPPRTFSKQCGSGGGPAEGNTKQNGHGKLKGLFAGFDSETGREMRASLRFGEELAKRQPTATTSDMTPPVVHEQQPTIHVWRSEQTTHRVQSASRPSTAARSPSIMKSSMLSHMVNASDQSTQLTHEASVAEEVAGGSEPYTTTSSRQKQSTVSESTAQVTDFSSNTGALLTEPPRANQVPDIRDITMQDDEEDEADIWLAEAKNSSSSPRGEEPHYADLPDDRYDNDERGSLDGKTKPSLPRSGTNALHQQQSEVSGHETTLMTNLDGDTSVSGLFWKAPEDQASDLRFGANQIKITRRELRRSGVPSFGDRENSGAFNVDKMLRTPQRIRDSLEDQVAREGKQELSNIPPPPPMDEAAGAETPPSEIGAFDTEELSLAESEESSRSITSERMPVNDSRVSDVTTPPTKTRVSLSPSKQRPLTPRSAIKGARQSFGAETERDSSDTSDQNAKRVIWARRSSHMDEEWIESSRSMISDSSIAGISASSIQNEDPNVLVHGDECNESTPTKTDGAQPATKTTGWFGWLGKGRAHEEDKASRGDQVLPSDKLIQTGGLSDSQHGAKLDQEASQWQPTTGNWSEREAEIAPSSSRSKSKSSSVKLPSYLTTPSYPSDPHRDANKPLSTAGDMSNTHFRTLHIIYAKSSRPRFHAPQIEECRPEIRKLVTQKWRTYIDEERANLGGFEFKLGEKEGRVIERFCREIEWGYLASMKNSGELQVRDLFETDGIWGGAAHGRANVEWGWTCEMLAQWLGRIVVGEVVREEEFGGKVAVVDTR